MGKTRDLFKKIKDTTGTFLAKMSTIKERNDVDSILNIHWKDWYWSWNSNTLATWCEEPARWKRPWCWERLKVGGQGDDRGWDGWMASLTQWTWVWVNSWSWWWTGRPGVLQSMGSQSRTWLGDWTELIFKERVGYSHTKLFSRKPEN